MNQKQSRSYPLKQETPRTRKETVLRMSLSGLVYLWIFILGILVGRGNAPLQFNIERLQDKLVALKKATVEKTIKRYQIAFKEVDKQVNLGFHEALKDPKADPPITPLPIAESYAPEKPVNADDRSGKSETSVPKKTRAPEFKKKNRVEVPEPWVIQVAATQDEAYGNQLAEDLKIKGFRAYLTTTEVSGKGTWYRIRVGGYAGRAEAETDCERLKKERFSPMIITPEKTGAGEN